MLDLLSSIVNTITTFVNFFITVLTALVTLILNIPNYVNMLISSINLLPPFLIQFSVAFISLTVIQYIVNRQSPKG